MTKEELAKTHVPCMCDKIYTDRGLTAPDCPYHSTDPESAMDEWARQQAIAFHSFASNHPLRYSEFNNGRVEYHVYTKEQLYELFIEQQNKP